MPEGDGQGAEAGHKGAAQAPNSNQPDQEPDFHQPRIAGLDRSSNH